MSVRHLYLFLSRSETLLYYRKPIEVPLKICISLRFVFKLDQFGLNVVSFG